DLLDKLEAVADSLPQLVQIGDGDTAIDFLQVAQQLIGGADQVLFSEEDIAAIRVRLAEIEERIAAREPEIAALLGEQDTAEVVQPDPDASDPGADRVEEIRQSVAEPGAEQPESHPWGGQ